MAAGRATPQQIKQAGDWVFRGCPHCRGTLHREQDRDALGVVRGTELVCVNCGRGWDYRERVRAEPAREEVMPRG